MSKSVKRLDLSEVETVAGASRLTGVPDQTLRNAIERGDVPTHELAGGTIVVRISDVKKRPKTKPGPKANRKL